MATDDLTPADDLSAWLTARRDRAKRDKERAQRFAEAEERRRLSDRRSEISAPEDVAGGITRGLTKATTGAARGIGWVTDKLTGGKAGKGLENWADETDQSIADYTGTGRGENPGAAGLTGEIGGRLLGEVAQTAVGSGLISGGIKALAKAPLAAGIPEAAGTVSRVLDRLGKGTALERATAQAAPFAPVDFVSGAGSAQRDPKTGEEGGFVLPGRAGAGVENILMGAVPLYGVEKYGAFKRGRAEAAEQVGRIDRARQGAEPYRWAKDEFSADRISPQPTQDVPRGTLALPSGRYEMGGPRPVAPEGQRLLASGPTAWQDTRLDPRALPPGQYEMGPATQFSRDVPETRPDRLLPSRTGARPTEGPSVLGPGIPQPPIGTRRVGYSGITGEPHDLSGMAATPDEVATYKQFRDVGLGVPPREPGMPAVRAGESQGDYLARAARRRDIQDEGLLRATERDARANPDRALRDPQGNLRQNLANVADDALEREHRAILEELANDEGLRAAATENPDYELAAGFDPHTQQGFQRRTEMEKATIDGPRRGKFKKLEDHFDAGGDVDPDKLAAMRQQDAEFRRKTMVRAQKEKAAQRLQAEIDRRAADPTRRTLDTSFDFGPESGATRPSVVSTIGGAGVGSAAGAALDDEHPLRGAVVGGVVGAGLGAGAGRALERGVVSRVVDRVGGVRPLTGSFEGERPGYFGEPARYKPTMKPVNIGPAFDKGTSGTQDLLAPVQGPMRSRAQLEAEASGERAPWQVQMPTTRRPQVVTEGGIVNAAERSGTDALYPRAGSTVDGREVGKDIKNTSSIAASLGDGYRVLPGVRDVPVSAFESLAPRDMFYAADDHARVKNLAEQIKQSGRVDPLIVGVDEKGPYILEGGHRAAALHSIGAKSFPALVVEEPDLVKAVATQKNRPGAVGDLGEGGSGTPLGQNRKGVAPARRVAIEHAGDDVGPEAATADPQFASTLYSRTARTINEAPFEKATPAQWRALLEKGSPKGEREFTGVDRFLHPSNWEENPAQTLTRDEVADAYNANRIQLGTVTKRNLTDEELVPLTRAENKASSAQQKARATLARMVEDIPSEHIPQGYSDTDEFANSLVQWGISQPDDVSARRMPIFLTPAEMHPLVFGDDMANAIQEAASARTAVEEAQAAKRNTIYRTPRPQYANYVEPGGENYREHLVTLGRRDSGAVDAEARRLHAKDLKAGAYGGEGSFDDLSRTGQDNYRNRARSVAGAEQPYHSSHWSGVENPLVHLRTTDRTLPNGEKTLFLEEMQSDWHQQGRRNGYKGDMTEPTIEQKSAANTRVDELNRLMIENVHRRDALERGSAERPALSAEYQRLIEERQSLVDGVLQRKYNQVPDAPFKKTQEWTELGLKKAIQEAVDGGYDRVAWTTGDQQAARYDLSKQVDHLSYSPETNKLTALKGGAVVHEGKYDHAALPDVVGKDVADKLLSSPIPDNTAKIAEKQAQHRALVDEMNASNAKQVRADTEGSRANYEQLRKETWALIDKVAKSSQEITALENAAKDHVLSGVDLKVGGEGMRGYYDNILPKVAKDYGKKLGVKIEVEPVAATGARGKITAEHLYDLSGNYEDGGRGMTNAMDEAAKSALEDMAEKVENGMQWPDALEESADRFELSKRYKNFIFEDVRKLEEKLGEEAGTPQNLSFKITPELKARVKSGGQPLGFAAPEVLQSVAGAGVGALAGGAIGDTPAEKVRNATIGAFAGGFAGRASGAATAARAEATAERTAIQQAMEQAVAKTAERAAAKRATGAEARAAERIKEPTRPYPKNIDALAADRSALNPPTPEALIGDLSRIANNPGVEAELRTSMDRLTKDGKIPPKIKVTFDQERQIASALGMDAAQLATRDPARALSGTELLALKDETLKTIARRRVAADVVKDMTRPATERELAEKMLPTLDKQFETYVTRLSRDRSQKGRDLNMMKIAAATSDDPNDWLVRAQAMAGNRPLNDETIAEIVGAVQKGEFARATKAIAELRKAPWSEKAGALYRAGLLSSFGRPFRDILSNSLNVGGVRQAEQAVATGLDRIIGSFTGVRTVDWSADASLKALWKGAKEGAENAKAIMKGNAADPEMLGRAAERYDFLRETNFDSPILDTYTKFIQRTLGAADAFAHKAAAQEAATSYARAIAKTERLTGKAFDERVAGLLKDPTPEMAMRVTEAATASVWQNKTKIGDAASGFRRPLGLAGTVAMPFTQTPAAMATQVLESTPAGLAAAVPDVVNLLKKANVPQAQANLVNKAARVSVGAGLMYAGYVAADHGLLTSWYPDDANEQNQWKQDGRIENAVKVGSKWVSLVGAFGPAAQLFTMGGYLHHMLNDQGKSLAEGLTTGTLASTGKVVLDSPMMQGPSTIIGALKQPDQALEKLSETFAGGMVPQFVQRGARALDTDAAGETVMRDVRGKSAGETVVNSIVGGIPGARQKLPAKVSALGESRSSGDGGVAAVVSPFRTSEDKTQRDPVARELARLNVGFGERRQVDQETRAALADRSTTEGRQLHNILGEVIDSDDYKSWPPAPWVADAVKGDPVWADENDKRSDQEKTQAALLRYMARTIRTAQTKARKAGTP